MHVRGLSGRCACCRVAGLRSCALLPRAAPPRPPSSCGLARTSTRRAMYVRARGLRCGRLIGWRALRVLQEGGTALIHAAYKGRTATAAELVRLGADINAKDNVRACEGAELGSTHRGLPRTLRVLQDGWTALMDAASQGHTATVAELVRLGADLNAKTNVRIHCS